MQMWPAWRPDAAPISTNFARDVSGVLPGVGGWQAWPSLATTSEALASACRGAFIARTSAGANVVFAGSATKLYKFAGIASAWEDVSRLAGGNYAVPDDGFWSFAQAGNLVIAVNGVDAPQVFNVDSDTDFSALGGSPPRGRYVKVVGDFVWLLDLVSEIGPTGVAATGRVQIQWSGFRDYDHWTLNDKSSDFATFPSGGFVQGCTSQLGGLVFLQRAIWQFQRHPTKIFDFAPVQEEQGTESPYSIVPHEANTFFYGTDGFMQVGPGGLRQIGNEWVDGWFLEDCNQERLGVICGAIDPVNMRVYWLYPSTSNSTTTLDRVICFDILNQEKPWTKTDLSATYIFTGATPGATLADLATLYTDLAGVPFPLGSRVWLGGAPGLAAFNSAHKLSFFSGPPIGATVQSGQFEPVPGKRFYVKGYRLIGDAENATGRVAVAERSQDDLSWGSSASLDATGLIPQRNSGRFMVVETTVPAGEDWSQTQGFDFYPGDLKPDGER